MVRSHLSYSLAVIPVFGSTALTCDTTFNICSNDTSGTSGFLHWWAGGSHPVQFGFFLSSCPTFAEVSRPKKTVGTRQSLIRILDYLTPSTVDLELSSFLHLFLSGMLHLQSCSPTQYTIQFLVSTTGPPSHEAFHSQSRFGVPATDISGSIPPSQFIPRLRISFPG